MMSNRELSVFFRDRAIGLVYDMTKLSVAAELLTIAAGFQALHDVGAREPHPSAFSKEALPLINLELVSSGHQAIFWSFTEEYHCNRR
jgi:hypothetical protein